MIEMVSSVAYLACPYTHKSAEVQEARAAAASMVAAKLMEQGFVVFSPITHGHKVAKHLPAELKNSHEFWMEQCLPMVERADVLIILTLDGWRESRGVAEEIAHARACDVGILIWQDETSSIPFELLDEEEFLQCGYLRHPTWE